MPFTFFAHQAPVLPLKALRPHSVDATALCVGSMAPDINYPFDVFHSHSGHTLIGVFTWDLMFTVVACVMIRRFIASVAFAQLPDVRSFRIHSLRVLAARQPPWRQTVVCAVIGAGSHVLIDGFTHADRFGSTWLGFDQKFVTLPVLGVQTWARALQYGGHIGGSLAGILMMWVIGRRRLLEQWYSPDAVCRARSFRLDRGSRITFWSIVAVGVFAGLGWVLVDHGTAPFKVIDATGIAVAIACSVRRCAPVETAALAGTTLRPGTASLRFSIYAIGRTETQTGSPSSEAVGSASPNSSRMTDVASTALWTDG